jgi:DNA topoisomerase I
MPRARSRRVSPAVRLLRNSQAAADAARLRLVTPGEPGIERRGSPKRFRYVRAPATPVRDRATLDRITALAIPPAWKNVWISPSPKGHVQATGFDARGRKQYRYHAEWRKIRDRAKYEDILPFVRALPRLRRRLARDLGRRPLTKDKVIATVLGIMERTQIRVGNREYARDNASYGLTTLQDRHARIQGDRVELRFRGKGGKPWRATLRDRRIASAMRRCRELPGQLLFQYVDDGGRNRPITSSDVNAYLRSATGRPFTAKEFRTWAGTLHASLGLLEVEPSDSEREAKRQLLAATERVSEMLGNTVAVCRRSYVDPLIFDCHLRGELRKRLRNSMRHARRHPSRGLSVEEAAVGHLLRSLGNARKPRSLRSQKKRRARTARRR